MSSSPTNPTTSPTPSTRTKTTTISASPSPALDRLLPQDVEAERATLGSMLHGHEAIAEVIDVFGGAGREVFALESHQHLYDVLVKLYTEGREIDGVVIKDELSRRGLWEKLGKFDFLGRLLGAVPSALRARHYAGIIHEKHLLRELVRSTHRVMQAALDADQPVPELLDYAEKEIFEVTERRVSGEAQALPDLLEDAFRTIESRGEGALTGEPTGFHDLDELTCGLQPGELVIVAGRPSMGKTACGLNIAEHLAIRAQPRRGVLFFSLEMSRQQIAQRLLCSRARVDTHRLRRGRHSADDLDDLKRAADEMHDAPLLIDDSADLTILELRARARMASRRYDIRAIFVDYLQLMRVPKAESRQVEVATVSRGLKALAKDLHVPVVAMAQLNRSPEDKGRRGNRPRMSDLRESGAIEQDADLIALLHRESYYRDSSAAADGEAPEAIPQDNVAELIIAKQRNGPVGTIELHWNAQYTRFDNRLPAGPVPDYAPPSSTPTPF